MEVQLKDLPILELKTLFLHTQSKYLWFLALAFGTQQEKIYLGDYRSHAEFMLAFKTERKCLPVSERQLASVFLNFCIVPDNNQCP